MLGALCLWFFTLWGNCNCYLSSEYRNSIYIIYILCNFEEQQLFPLYLLDIISSHTFNSYQGKYSAIMWSYCGWFQFEMVLYVSWISVKQRTVKLGLIVVFFCNSALYMSQITYQVLTSHATRVTRLKNRETEEILEQISLLYPVNPSDLFSTLQWLLNQNGRVCRIRGLWLSGTRACLILKVGLRAPSLCFMNYEAPLVISDCCFSALVWPMGFELVKARANSM